MAKKVGIEIEVDSKGAVKSVKKLGTVTEKTTKKITKSTKKASQGFVDFDSKINLATISIAGMAVGIGALTAKFATLGLESFKNAEKVETQFKTLLGSAEEAKERYAELAQFASSTPFDLNQVAQASKILETLTKGMLSTGEGLRKVGDASAIAGVRFDELAVTVGRAYSGLQSNRAIGESLARLQELGLVAGETRTKIENLQKEAKGKEAWDVLSEALERTKGGMNELSKTLEGKTSTLVDNLGLLSQEMLKTAGVTDILKNGMDAITESINKQLKEYELLDAKSTDINKRTITQHKAVIAESENRVKKEKEQLGILEKRLSVAKDISDAERADLQGSRQRQLKNESLEEGVALKREEVKESERLLAESKAYLASLEAIKKAKASKATKDEEQSEEERLEAQRQAQLKWLEEQEKINDEKNRKKNAGLQYEIEVENELIRGQAQEEVEIFLEKERKKQEEAVKFALAEKKRKKDLANYEQRLTLDTASIVVGSLREIFGENKAFASADIIINTARGIQRSLADLPFPFNAIQAGAIGASGAVQLAKVNGAKFADGGYVEGAGTGRSDSINAQLSNGEFVVNAQATNNNREILEAINSGGSAGSTYNISVNAGVGTDGNALAQMIVNEIKRADELGLEPSVV